MVLKFSIIVKSRSAEKAQFELEEKKLLQKIENIIIIVQLVELL